MGRLSEAEISARLAELFKAAEQDSVDRALSLGRSLPESWRRQSVGDMVYRLRSRFALTQRQLATLAGLPSSKIAKIERGQNIELRTLFQVLAGLGCDLVILPVSRLNAQELWNRTHRLWAEGYMERRRRYPRR